MQAFTERRLAAFIGDDCYKKRQFKHDRFRDKESRPVIAVFPRCNQRLRGYTSVLQLGSSNYCVAFYLRLLA